MIVQGNTIVRIEYQDIVNNTFKLPKGVTKIGRMACYKNLLIKEIPEGIEEVGDAAFKSCFNLKKLPNTLKIVGSNSFTNCHSLISLPSSIRIVGSNAFSGCDRLKEISEGIEVASNFAFQNCSALKKIPSTLKEVGYASFQGCISLEEMPDSIIKIGEYSFEDCKSLKNISKNLKTVESNAFTRCTSLEEMPDSIQSIGSSSFAGCTSLRKISNNITIVSPSAFVGCSSLRSIPDGVKTVRCYGFMNCTSLEEMPDSITNIYEYSFYGCESLKNISKKLTKIPRESFANCTSLKEIPDTITEIEGGAFSSCKSLTKISKGIKVVDESVFFECTSLEEIPNTIIEAKEASFSGCTKLKELPDSLTKIGFGAFDACTSLQRVSKNIEEIGSYAFADCPNLKTIDIESFPKLSQVSLMYSSIQEIRTPYGIIDIKEFEPTKKEIVNAYLYLYANSLLKEKYSDMKEFLKNKYINRFLREEFMEEREMIKKFQKTFYKLRKNWNIHADLLEYMRMEDVENFDAKTWNKIKNLISWEQYPDMIKAFSEIIIYFGIFEQDQERLKRVEQLEAFLTEKPYILPKIDYIFLKRRCREQERLLSQIEEAFEEAEEDVMELKKESAIPEEYKIYLKGTMDQRKIQILKKLRGHYGKEINDFFRANYEQKKRQVFVLSEKGYQNPKIREVLFEEELEGHISFHTLHRIFDGNATHFNKEFLEFFLDNLPLILVNERAQTYMRRIQEKYDTIQNYYQYTSGTKKISLKQALDYIKSQKFHAHPGNREFAKEAAKAGVVSEEAFQYYEKAFERNQERRRTSLIKRKKIYTINGYQIQAELLRKDDGFAALVGEVNNTNCCQVYDGVGHNCMAHAVYSDDGGIFVTKLIEDDKEIFLTQSWDWQNNNVYCHDNIEATPYLKGNNELKKAVAEVFRLDGEEIIQKSSKEIEKYIRERAKTIKHQHLSLTQKEKEFKKLKELEERQVIRVVTTGAANDDLDIERYFSSFIQIKNDMFVNNRTYTMANFQPVEYNHKQVYFSKTHSAYTDSDGRQYIIAGSLENLYIKKVEPLVPLYKDERRVILEKQQIRDYTFHKMQMIEKEAYPEEMMQYKNMGEEEFLDERPNVYLGEDWYLVYQEQADNGIYISDLAKKTPTLLEEEKNQLQEMSQIMTSLLETYDEIEADLKEDTSYLLYLINKKRGLIEQIGEDEWYYFGDDCTRKLVTEKEQEEYLRNIKIIKNEKNPDNRMHHVIFQKRKIKKRTEKI